MSDSPPVQQELADHEIARDSWGLVVPNGNGNGSHRAAATREPLATEGSNGRGPRSEPIDELLHGLRWFGLDYRGHETNPDGPWRAQCPRCVALSQPDDLPLTITRSGHLHCRHGCDPETIAEMLRDARAAAAPKPPPTTWAPVGLERILAGEYVEPAPSILIRTDGRALLYEGRVHAVNAEPEALKTWLALRACLECMQNFQRAMYVDFEDSPGGIVSRLLALGATADEVTSGFVYLRPDEPLVEPALKDLEAALELKPVLVVVDGVTEAFSRQGLNPLDNGDVATWLDVLPRRLVRTGAAVLLLDHVVKDREQRGRYAIGAQHKLAGVDVAYSMRVIEPFARGRDGLVAIKVEKDRPGSVREFAAGGQVALLRARSGEDGGVRIKLEPPEQQEGGFRPTRLMQHVSERLERDAGLGKRAVREAVSGRGETVDLALELLISEGYVEARPEGNRIRHFSVKPYREDDDEPERVPVSGTCPALNADTGESERVPVSLPLGDTDAGHELADAAQNGDRVPCCCADGGELDDDGRCTRCWGWQ